MTPAHASLATPNTVLTTPFRTKEGQVALTPSQTPGTSSGGGVTTGQTPVRDMLSINNESSLESDWPQGTPQASFQVKHHEAEKIVF